jgi:hypothetical protein
MKPNRVARATKNGAAASHQRRWERAGERHHDDQREADEQELGAELDPVREERLEIAAVGLVVAAVPPHLGEPERNLREPDEREGPSIPSSIPVPIRPAADSFAKRTPCFAYRIRTPIRTSCERTNSIRKKRS